MDSSFIRTLPTLSADGVDPKRAAAEVARIHRDSLHVVLLKAEHYMRMHHLGEAAAIVEREMAAVNRS